MSTLPKNYHRMISSLCTRLELKNKIKSARSKHKSQRSPSPLLASCRTTVINKQSSHKCSTLHQAKTNLQNQFNFDINVQLVDQLQRYNQNLIKKLQTHTMIYTSESVTKCLKHGCYLSVYDKQNHNLLCAECFNKNNIQNKIDTNLKNKIKIQNLIPIEKSKYRLISDIKEFKDQINEEICTLKKIEDILEESFDYSGIELEINLKVIEKKYEETIKKLREKIKDAKDSLLEMYIKEKNRYQLVIKELGRIRSIYQEYMLGKEMIRQKQEDCQGNLNSYKYISACEEKNKHNPQGNRFLSKKLDDLKHKNKVNLLHSFSFSPELLPFYFLQPLEDKTIKQLIYKHEIFRQLTRNAKFYKSGIKWSKQSQSNRVNILLDMKLREISQISQLICS